VRFVDTNVWLYAASTSARVQAKAGIARRLLMASDLALSVQVLQEFYVQATRPTRAERLTHQEAVDIVSELIRLPAQEITVELVQAAIATQQRFGLSYWDAAIVEAARTIGCDEVLSEDLCDGQDYDGVVVVNPFR
jgi:predicted nucleic acid-binding protein